MQQILNQAHNGLRTIGERGNALLKTTFKALRNVSPQPLASYCTSTTLAPRDAQRSGIATRRNAPLVFVKAFADSPGLRGPEGRLRALATVQPGQQG